MMMMIECSMLGYVQHLLAPLKILESYTQDLIMLTLHSKVHTHKQFPYNASLGTLFP